MKLIFFACAILPNASASFCIRAVLSSNLPRRSPPLDCALVCSTEPGIKRAIVLGALPAFVSPNNSSRSNGVGVPPKKPFKNDCLGGSGKSFGPLYTEPIISGKLSQNDANIKLYLLIENINQFAYLTSVKVVLDVGDVLDIRLLDDPPLPVRVIVNDPVRLVDSLILVGVEVSFLLLLSFHDSADNGRLHPFRSRNPIFNIEPFKRNIVAILFFVDDNNNEKLMVLIIQFD
ncbi:hypothetical protein DERP_008287 [Dermatophagoides pteronyssinus]|uniref:Uncharacterized protein n=1 Tax=Dermatophagoides pteronyssinus TaxID=6956 RepID=A0ABQ8J6P8_DERPT|nr:hypothetical protein DERP_008287 [Dermatophagoides pteronyssinus]